MQSDNDGFVETILEIRSLHTYHKQHSDELPEANPIYHRGHYREDEALTLLYQSLSHSTIKTQTLMDRYSDASEYQLIYQRYDGKQGGAQWTPPAQLDVALLFPPPRKKKVRGMFSSAFESGNLCSAYQLRQSSVYELLMHNDSNTKGYTQWFNFALYKPKQDRITVRIVNFLKSHSHFKAGMKPIVLNDQSEPVVGVELLNVTYRQNHLTRVVTSKYGKQEHKNYYTLQFDVRYVAPVATIYISMNYPYTREKLQSFLADQPCLQLTKTLLGYACPYLLITDTNVTTTTKKKVIITARQHPGETVSSFVMEGVVSFLRGDSIESTWLKREVEFYIFPMVNIDGVQAGNFRCDLTGKDLNRLWDRPHKSSHPVIYKLKRLIQKMIQSETAIDFFIDLHGHSKKLNNFLYGCRNDNDPVGCRLYPKLMQTLCPFFRFDDCTFSLSKHKIKTARAIVYYALKERQHSLINAFTLETSFYGYENKEGKIVQFTIPDFSRIGADLLRTLFVYWEGHLSQDDDSHQYADIHLDDIRQELTLQSDKFKHQDENCEPNSDGEQMGSDSQAEVDMLTDLERAGLAPPPIVDLMILKQQLYAITNKEKSKSVSLSNPENQRSKFNQAGALTQIRIINQKLITKSQTKYPKFIAPSDLTTTHLSIAQRSQSPQRGYFSKKRATPNVEVILPSNMRVYAQYTQDQSTKMVSEKQQKGLTNYIAAITPKNEIVQNKTTIENYFSNNLIPAFQISRQYFKKQVKRTVDQSRAYKSKAQSLIVPTQNHFKSDQCDFVPQKQIILPPSQMTSYINSQVPRQISPPQIPLQLPTQLLPPSSVSQIEEERKDQSMRQHPRKQSKTKLNHDDMMMTQLLRGIWTMNQIKYGQQLKQPKQFKLPIREDEDIRIFDDKKIQSATRFINQRAQAKLNIDKLFDQ